MEDEPEGSDATPAEQLSQAETPAVDDARAPGRRMVIRVLGGPEERSGATRPSASPTDRLPPFDVSFFDAAPTEPSQVTRAQPISVTTGREGTQSYGDLVGEPGRDGDELIASPTPNHGAAQVVDPLAAIDAARAGSHAVGHSGTGSPADPRHASSTQGQASSGPRRHRRMLAVGPIAVLVAAVAWIVLLAAPPRPKLGSTATSGRHRASSTPTPTAEHAKPTTAAATPTTKQPTSAPPTSTTAVPGAVTTSPQTSTSAGTQSQLAGLSSGGSGVSGGSLGGSGGGSGGGSSQPAGSTGATAGGGTYVGPTTQGGGGGASTPSPPTASPPATSPPVTTAPSPPTTQPATPAAGCDNPIVCQP